MGLKPTWSSVCFIVFGGIVFCVFLFLMGFLFGNGKFFGTHPPRFAKGNPEPARTLQGKQNTFFFVRPLLEIEDDPKLRVLTDLERSMERYITERRVGGELESASIFVRDLSTGAWGGVDEDESYIPASMSKVVLLIALLRQGLEDEHLFEKKVMYTGVVNSEGLDSSNTSPHPLIVGESYTVDDLVRRMILFSDNTATATLMQEVNKHFLQDVYMDLSVDKKEDSGVEEQISPRQYSIFFRVLFNASYLPWSISEQALELLSKTTYTEGLIASLPREITVSHKFGHREAMDEKTHYLHDCGIVYAPEHPYFVCVMTRGTNIDVLTETIRHLSSMVYENMSKGWVQP